MKYLYDTYWGLYIAYDPVNIQFSRWYEDPEECKKENATSITNPLDLFYITGKHVLESQLDTSRFIEED